MIKSLWSVLIYAPKKYWEQKTKTLKQFKSFYKFCMEFRIKKNPYNIKKYIWGLDIQEAWDILLYMYYFSKPKIADKEEADRVFLNNMLRLSEENYRINLRTEAPIVAKFILNLRRKKIYKYYLNMKYYGSPMFWLNKNKAGTMHFSKLRRGNN